MDLLKKLENLLVQTRHYQILTKSDIYLYFSFLNGIVDIILVTPLNYICFKDYWTFNNLDTNTLNNYNLYSSNINLSSEKKFIFILLNKNTEKKTIVSNYVYLIQKNNQDKLLKELSYLLYSNGIYYYDLDFDTIMLD